MGDTRKIFCQLSFYDQPAIQELLEDMAQRGWMIKQPGNFFWTFKRIEPKKLKFAVTYFPNASEFDPGPSQKELTKLDFCAQDGWKLVGKWGAMQIFCNEDTNAVPIETDPVAQVANIRKTIRKNTLLPQLFTVGLVIYWLGFQCWQLMNDPVEYLSSAFNLYQLPVWLCLLIMGLYEIWGCLSWSRRAVKAAEEDGVFLPMRSRPAVGIFIALISWLFLVRAFFATGTNLTFLLLWCGVLVAIKLIANLLMKCLKKRGARRWVNMALSMGSIFLMTFFSLIILVTVVIRGNVSFGHEREPVGTYEYHGREYEIYDDPLPLVIEDIMDAEGEWSKEMDVQGTGLVVCTEYEQRPLWNEYDERPRPEQLSYTVIDVKVPFLYDFLKQSILDSRQDIILEDYVHADHYESIDPTLWGAKEAYQAHFSRSVLDEYLVCWDGRIVEINFRWDPTPEQIKIAGEKLAPS